MLSAPQDPPRPATPTLGSRPIQITMNTPYEEMVAAPGQTRIVFIHVGKCAGGSVIRTMTRCLTDRHVMFEMHTAKANRIIRDTLAGGDKDFIYLITLRDPISRFVSSYDWDKHSIYLAGLVKRPRIRDFYVEFPNVDTLARALSSDDGAKADRALEFARYAHMGMGQGWYMPPDVVEALPAKRTYLCELETLQRDLQRFAGIMDSRNLTQQVDVPHDKSDYKKVYENREEVFGPPLSEAGRRNLRILLNEDYAVHRRLKERFAVAPAAPA